MVIKSDGNGGLVIPKWFIALVSIILIIGSSFATVVAYSVGIQKDVEYLKQGVEDRNEICLSQERRIDSIEKVVPVINTKLASIEKTVDKINDKLGGD